MATAKSKTGEEPEPASEPEPEQQEGEEPERVVDPPEASSRATGDSESSSDQRWVLIDQSAMLTLPSGASYNFNAGNVMHLSAEDAAFVVDQGYGSETDDPNEG